jgi:hypothetical protein
VPLQHRKTAQKQCADNHLRPQGARIENPLYLAIIFLPASPDLGTISNTESSLRIICKRCRQRAMQRLPPTHNRLAHGTPFLRNWNDRERADG